MYYNTVSENGKFQVVSNELIQGRGIKLVNTNFPAGSLEGEPFTGKPTIFKYGYWVTKAALENLKKTNDLKKFYY